MDDTPLLWLVCRTGTPLRTVWSPGLRSNGRPNVLGMFVIYLAYSVLEMWANAQRDGRPAEYRWRPLFNAAKFG